MSINQAILSKLFVSQLFFILLISSCSPLNLVDLSTPTNKNPTESSMTSQPTKAPSFRVKTQGFSPFGLAITKDGKYAYVSFDLSEKIMKIQLSDFSVVAETDLSDYFPIEAELIALDNSETELFVYSSSWKKLLVLDTSNFQIKKSIEDIQIVGMLPSKFGSDLITWGGGPVITVINTETIEATQKSFEHNFILKLAEKPDNPDLWYLAIGNGPGITETKFGLFNNKTHEWLQQVTLPKEVTPSSISSLIVLSNQQKAYISTFEGWYPDYHAYGSLVSINLADMTTNIIPIDGGAGGLEKSKDDQKLYIGTGWPKPDDKNILVLDTQKDEIIDSAHLEKNIYHQAFTQMNWLSLDPNNDQVLYGTNTDANALIKLDLKTLKPIQINVLNQQTFWPLNFVRQPGNSTGYILIHNSTSSAVFDINQAQIVGISTFPIVRQDSFYYEVAATSTDKMYIAQGESILEVDAADNSLIRRVDLPKEINGLWNFQLSCDEKSIFAFAGSANSQVYPDKFLIIDTDDLTIKATLNLDGSGYSTHVFELPDSSKLYLASGQQNGMINLQILDSTDGKILKNITFDEPGLQGITSYATNNYTYDPKTHTLFVGATQVVLGIDTEKDEISRVIKLSEIGNAIGLENGQLTYINAVGLVFNPNENYLYIAHGDRSFVSIYDLTNNKFLPRAIPLIGYFPSVIFANDDFSKLFTLNSRSDDLSIIDVQTKKVEKVIDLHDYLP